MSSAYGRISKPTASLDALLPLHYTLKDQHTQVYVSQVSLKPKHSRQYYTCGEAELALLQQALNYEITKGDTYPQEHVLNKEEFKAYFLSYDAFVVRQVDTDAVLGLFYIKPNFPGRCAHICNGGFITLPHHQNKGVGLVMGTAFKVLAPALGYQASMFNLVFMNNIASVKLWRRLGFKEIGRLPKAGRLSTSPDYVDALMFYYDFTRSSKL